MRSLKAVLVLWMAAMTGCAAASGEESTEERQSSEELEMSNAPFTRNRTETFTTTFAYQDATRCQLFRGTPDATELQSFCKSQGYLDAISKSQLSYTQLTSTTCRARWRVTCSRESAQRAFSTIE